MRGSFFFVFVYILLWWRSAFFLFVTPDEVLMTASLSQDTVASNAREIPAEVQRAFDESARYLPAPSQQLTYYMAYSRYDPSPGRRQSWPETAHRTIDWLDKTSGYLLTPAEKHELHQAILNQEAMPAMRAIAMAGAAADRQNASIFNCAYLTLHEITSFKEILLLSMAGVGVGYSVESAYVSQLPVVASQTSRFPAFFVIQDTTEGWGEAIEFGLRAWWEGWDVTFDYSQIRREGSVLRVKGGRASGPEPLREALTFARATVLGAEGRRLTSLECHDLACSLAGAAVSGGVRRSALISLFDIDDELMLTAKQGKYPKIRWNANNSAVVPVGGISRERFDRWFDAMVESQAGEPGLVSRHAIFNTLPKRRTFTVHFGFNPCVEAINRPNQFCNLSLAVVRAGDKLPDLVRKVRLAATFGTIQSMALHLPGLRPEWVQNGEEERIMGVDLAGMRDNPLLEEAWVLELLRDQVIDRNQELARRFGINPSSATTCIKPGGNSAMFLNGPSGIGGRVAPFYIRRMRISAHDPLRQVLLDAGVKMTPENGQTEENARTWVVSFPMKSPEGATLQVNETALDRLERWKKVKIHYTEHSVSTTIGYKDHELPDIREWMWENRNITTGISFYPDNAKYEQVPEEPISEERYNQMVAEFPEINFARLYLYETEDYSAASSESGCTGTTCEVDPSALREAKERRQAL